MRFNTNIKVSKKYTDFDNFMRDCKIINLELEYPNHVGEALNSMSLKKDTGRSLHSTNLTSFPQLNYMKRLRSITGMKTNMKSAMQEIRSA